MVNNNLVTEITVLMACVYHYNILESAVNTLEITDFSEFSYRAIFSVMRDMCSKKTVVSLDTLMRELVIRKENEILKLVLTFYDEKLDPTFLLEKIDELQELSLQRNLINKCQSGVSYFSQKKDLTQLDAIQWADEVSNIIFKYKKESSYKEIKNILQEFSTEPSMTFIQCLQNRQEQVKNGVSIEIGLPTHLRSIDAIFDGFKPGHLIIVGARPGVGKTTFMCNIIVNSILKSDVPVGVMSLEMENVEIAEKLVLLHADINHNFYKTGRITPEQFQKIYVASREIASKKVLIDDTAGININLLYSRAKHWKNAYGIKVIFIDYLQLIKGSGKVNNKYEEITAISQTLKKIAKDLKICVVSLAQLNREAAKGGKPTVSDLRDSGSIEQDADAIFLLNDPSILDPNNTETLEVHLAKNRFGSTGKLSIHFDKKTSKMSDMGIKLKEGKEEWFTNKSAIVL